MATEYRTRRFTVEEYFRLAEVGILKEDERVELLDGEIVLLPAIGPDHNSVVLRMNHLLVSRLGERAMVLPQGSMRLSDTSAPEPDFCVLRPKDDFYRSGLALPEDVYALVEVSGASLAYDRGRKLKAYARARIPEYWIADLAAWSIIGHRNPNDLGYAEVTTYAADAEIAFEAAPTIRFRAAELLGPR
jgi:Uma2 family endonuclease